MTTPGSSSRRPLPGLRDVAELAGVSMKTVSNVVHGRPNVSDRTRSRVREAIEQLGYRPQLAARQLRTGSSGIVTLAVPSLAYSYFSDLAQAFTEEAQRCGRTVLLHSTSAGVEEEAKVLDGFDLIVGDGVVFSPLALGPGQFVRTGRSALPMVLIGEHVPAAGLPARCDHVRVDNARAVAEATRHLLEGGRSRIAFLGSRDGPDEGTRDLHGSAALRVAGYRAALAEHGAAHPAILQNVEDWHRQDGRAAVAELLARHGDIDGIVCGNDDLALGVLAGLRAAGRRVPDDVAVVGYDDTPDAPFTSPPLTSIAPDKHHLARTALDLLGERIAGYDGPSRVVDTPYELVVRESTAPRQRDAGRPRASPRLTPSGRSRRCPPPDTAGGRRTRRAPGSG